MPNNLELLPNFKKIAIILRTDNIELVIPAHISLDDEYSHLNIKDMTMEKDPILIYNEKTNIPVNGANLFLLENKKDKSYFLENRNDPLKKLKELEQGARTKLEILVCCQGQANLKEDIINRYKIELDEYGWFKLSSENLKSLKEEITRRRLSKPKEDNKTIPIINRQEIVVDSNNNNNNNNNNIDNEFSVGPSLEEKEKVESNLFRESKDSCPSASRKSSSYREFLKSPLKNEENRTFGLQQNHESEKISRPKTPIRIRRKEESNSNKSLNDITPRFLSKSVSVSMEECASRVMEAGRTPRPKSDRCSDQRDIVSSIVMGSSVRKLKPSSRRRSSVDDITAEIL